MLELWISEDSNTFLMGVKTNIITLKTNAASSSKVKYCSNAISGTIACAP